jgi:hypothetical protein
MDLLSYLSVGNFVIIDLIAATTNTLTYTFFSKYPDG